MLLGGPRLALSRHRKVVIALSVITGLALSGVGLESASASTRSRLAVSFKPDRSSAVRLDGSAVKGKIYVFVRDSKTLDKVDFYLDRSRRTKRPVRTDRSAPFDLVGTAADGTALPYDTTKLADGSHSIRVVLTWADGTTSSRRGDFKVANKGATSTPTTPTHDRQPHPPPSRRRQPRRLSPLRQRRPLHPRRRRLRPRPRPHLRPRQHQRQRDPRRQQQRRCPLRTGRGQAHLQQRSAAMRLC